MLETLLSAAGGGLFGLIGSGFKTFMKWKEEKERYKFQIAMAAEERQNMEMEMRLAEIKGAIDLELQESANDAANLQAAIRAESQITGTSQWVADLRGSVRPFLTYGLCLCSFVLIMGWPENQWNNEFVFMAMTAVTFWFGDRPRR